MFDGEIELYNLGDDLGESKDVASNHPEIVERLQELMDLAHQPNPNWQARGKPPSKRPEPGDGSPRF